MRIHLIAIGGSAMHNLALALHYNHHTVTGSDDEIYNPARDRLHAAGLLPATEGWHPEYITTDLDAIILGMHARLDNPELARAKALNLPIYSYPEFLYEHAKDKKRVVIAGSHGKTTTTAMILHVLHQLKIDADYLVGAQLEGFDRMVRLSDAPLIVIEGDEYLSSPLDRRPKILHYRPHLAIITGIAWDHINVFPTFDNYVEQFRLFIAMIERGGKLFYYKNDEELRQMIDLNTEITRQAYTGFKTKMIKGQNHLLHKDQQVPLQIFGAHNLENLYAAFLVCVELGISETDFFQSIQSFTGAAKRMQRLKETEQTAAYLDFAHAPSKVRATVKALKARYPERILVACLELHTFSSLNKTFLQGYKETLAAAERAMVFFSPHTLEMKKLPPISLEEVQAAFDHPNLKVINDNQEMVKTLEAMSWNQQNLLLMSSGTFGGLDLPTMVEGLE